VDGNYLSELNMGEKQPYPTSAQLDAIVLQMYRAGIVYSEAVREFKKKFILTALQDVNWNETKAALTLRIHRNTLARTLRQLDLDFHALHRTERRPVRGVDLRTQKKIAS
jgi:Fis family transcriptional regulator, factor for inversion stimulation protein